MTVRADTTAARASIAAVKLAIGGASEHIIRAAVDAATQHAKTTTLWKDQTGATRASIVGEVTVGSVTGLRGFVKAGGASTFLQWGTRGHGPVVASHLRFVINGRTIFAKWVRGIKARPFMTEAAEHGAIAAEFAAEFYIGAAVR